MSLSQFATQRFDKIHALKKWLRNPGQGREPCDMYELKKQLPKNAPPPPTTHTELMGGQYVVPAEINDEFLWYLAVSMHQSRPSSLVERRTEYFRYHLDLDFAEQEQVTLERLRPYMMTVFEVVRRFFPFANKDFLECAICAADSTKTVTAPDGKTKQVKSGFHIMFPHIWVHTDQALAIRADLILHLSKTFGERKQPFKNDWADVVDETVYIGSGLRVIAAIKVSSCKNRACKDKWSQSKKKPPPPPKIEGLNKKATTPTAKSGGPSGPGAASKSDQEVVPTSADIYKALTSSTTAALDSSATKATSGGAAAGQAASTAAAVDCDLCDNKGRIYEGRPYYLIALWDFKGDDLHRMVKVPKVVSDDTPKYASPVASLYPDAHHTSELQISNEPVARNVYYAMSMPHWTPLDEEAMDEEGGDDFFAGLGLEPMDLGVSKDGGDDDEFVTVPLRDLLVFGDPFTQTGQDEAAWENVRRLHNTLRFTTLRSPPALEMALKAHYAKSPVPIQDEVTKHCPHFKRPHDAPAYSNHRDALSRHNMGGAHAALYTGVRLEHSAEAKWARSIQLGKKGYINDDEVLVEVEDCIRKNVGVRLDQEPSHPYDALDVTAIIFNVTDQNKKPRPKSYLVIVNGFGSGYCINKGSTHNSNKVYFVITKDGIQQRCHCKCAVNRKNGYCSQFKSDFYELPYSVTSKLFENTSDTTSHLFLPGYDEVDLETDVAPRASIVNFDPQKILAHLPAELPRGCLSYENFLKRKRGQEFLKYGLDDPEERLQKIRGVEEAAAMDAL